MHSHTHNQLLRRKRRHQRRVLYAVHAHERLVTHQVLRAQQIARVAVQRRVRLGMRQQQNDRAANRLYGPHGRPRRAQNVDADLARAELHVRVENTRGEVELGRHHRVRGAHVRADLEEVALERRVFWSFYEAFPSE